MFRSKRCKWGEGNETKQIEYGFMKTIHWVTAHVLRVDSTYLVMLGMAFGLIPYYLLTAKIFINFQHIFAIYGVGLMLISVMAGGQSCKRFYDGDFAAHMKEGGGGRLDIPSADYWFSQTQKLNIPLNRKIAGYIYAGCKVYLFVCLGIVFSLYGWPLLLQKINLARIL